MRMTRDTEAETTQVYQIIPSKIVLEDGTINYTNQTSLIQILKHYENLPVIIELLVRYMKYTKKIKPGNPESMHFKREYMKMVNYYHEQGDKSLVTIDTTSYEYPMFIVIKNRNGGNFYSGRRQDTPSSSDEIYFGTKVYLEEIKRFVPATMVFNPYDLVRLFSR